MAEPILHSSLVLVVDDEPIVLRSITSVLALEGFRVIVAENGVAGLEAFLTAQQHIDLVVADVVMPNMGGVEMAKRIREARPDARILLMSGYSDAVLLTLPGAEFPLMRKPFLPEDLVRTIRANLQPPTATA